MKKIFVSCVVLALGAIQLPAFCGSPYIDNWADLQKQVQDGDFGTILKADVNIIAPANAGTITNSSKHTDTGLSFGPSNDPQYIQGDGVHYVFDNEGTMEIDGSGADINTINSYDTSNPSNTPAIAAILNNGQLMLMWVGVNGGISQSSSSAKLWIENTGPVTLSGSTNSITGGSINFYNGTPPQGGNLLNIAGGFVTAGADIQLGTGNTLQVSGSGNVVIDGADAYQEGFINVTGGQLTLDNVTLTTATGAQFTQSGGTTTLNNSSSLTLASSSSSITGGTVALTDASSLTLGANGSSSSSITGGTVTLTGASSMTVENGKSNNAAAVTMALDSSSFLTVMDNPSGTGSTLTLNSGSLIQRGNTLNIGVLNSYNSSNALNVATGATITQGAQVNLYAPEAGWNNNLNITGGNVTLDSADVWGGIVNLSSGTLTLDSISRSNGGLYQTGGTLNLTNNTALSLSQDNVTPPITTDGSGSGTAIVNIGATTGTDTSSLTLPDGITLAPAADGDNLIVNVGNGSTGNTFTAQGTILKATMVNINAGNTLKVIGSQGINSTSLNGTGPGIDTWAGAVNVSGGTLNLNAMTSNGAYNQTGGTLNLTNATSLNLAASNNITTNGTGTGSTTVQIGTLTGADGSSLNVGTGSSIITAKSGDTLTVNVGSATSTGNSLNITGGTLDSTAVVNLNANNNLNISAGTATLNEAGAGIDTLVGDVNLSGGDLYLDSIVSNIALTQTGGNIYIENGLTGTSPALGEHHFHGGNIELRNNSALTLAAPDTWTTTNFNVAGGTLTMDNFSHNATSSSGTINQTSGTTRLINGSNLIIGDNSHFTGGNLFIDSASNLDITTNGTTFGASLSGSGVIVKYGTGTLLLSGRNSAFDGAMVINAGNVNYSSAESFMSGVTRLSGGNLGLTYGANAEMGTDIELTTGSTLTINTNGYNVLSGTDCITSTAGQNNTLIKDGSGQLTFDARTNPNINYNLQVNQGTVNLTSNNLNFNDNVTVGQGPGNPTASLNITANSTTFNNNLTLSNAYMNMLYGGFNVNGNMSVGSTINTMNGMIAANNIAGDFNIGPSGSANFAVDVSPSTGTSDSYFVNGNVTTTNPGGVINVSNVNLIGPVTANRNINLNVFGASATSTVDPTITFSATNNLFTSPYAQYALSSQGNGGYSLNFVDYNPQAFRGQVATEAAYANQLTTNNVIFDHIGLVTQQLLSSDKPNVYANENPLFAPYQYDKQGGNLWYKAYGNLERLQLSQNINTQNNMWGSLIGADFPLVSLKNGWKLLPTAYVGYTGAYQTYNGVDMYQNGGQAGVMGTFYKGNFIESLLANVGGYGNDMNVNGTRDQTGNWFAGVASKSAYNISLPKDFILQPNFLISYNAFGNQNWSSNFGNTSMLTNMLNGLNVAPGLNLILNKETWSVYATTQLMFNVMNGCSGSINDISLPTVKMGSTYFSYGLGFTKRFKDRLSVYGQVLFSNGVRTGVGFQGGLQWKF